MLYFIRNERTGAIKIGCSGNPSKRLGALRTASSDPLAFLGSIHGDRPDESALHRRFAALHIHGEWFRGEPELLAEIHRLIARRKNVGQECEARGCRYGLSGVLIRRVDTAEVARVLSSSWDEQERLVLRLEGGDYVLADRCELESEWPLPVLLDA